MVIKHRVFLYYLLFIKYRWTHGRYGIGKRISSENSTRIIDAINNKELDNVKTYNFKYFNIAVPENINGVN